jgi:hypothetical protein
MQKRTPYDFVAITDHAEYFGGLKEFSNPDSPLAKSEFAKMIEKGQTDPKAGPLGDVVGAFLQTFKEFPPRQKAGSWDMAQAFAQLAAICVAALRSSDRRTIQRAHPVTASRDRFAYRREPE